jgi:hypothetical protein
MPMEIEGWDHARWTSTAAFPTRNAPFAGLGAVVLPGAEKKLPSNTTPGLKITIRKCVESKFMASGAGGVGGGEMYRMPTKDEVTLSVVPKLEELGFEVVGEPVFVQDASPVWMFRKVNKPLCAYQLYMGAGPFKGLTYTCFKTPSVEDKIKFAPRAVYQWTVAIRPTDRELTEERGREVLRVMRESHQVLGKISGLCGLGFGRTRKPFKVEPVPVPDPPTPNKSFFGTTALIIGLALAGMTFIKRT